MKHIIPAYVNDKGQISTPSMMEFKEEIAKYPKQEIEIDVGKRKRTSQQNRTLHWGLRIFADGLTNLGYKIKMPDLKFELKKKGFFGWVEYETKEGIQRRPKDTHELDVTESSNAFQDLQIAASHYEIIIPDPNEEEYRLGKEFKPSENL